MRVQIPPPVPTHISTLEVCLQLFSVSVVLEESFCRLHHRCHLLVAFPLECFPAFGLADCGQPDALKLFPEFLPGRCVVLVQLQASISALLGVGNHPGLVIFIQHRCMPRDGAPFEFLVPLA